VKYEHRPANGRQFPCVAIETSVVNKRNISRYAPIRQSKTRRSIEMSGKRIMHHLRLETNGVIRIDDRHNGNKRGPAHDLIFSRA
jgi:hypothetical protein